MSSCCGGGGNGGKNTKHTSVYSRIFSKLPMIVGILVLLILAYDYIT